MAAYQPGTSFHAERRADWPQSPAMGGHLECEIHSWLPLLRALARMRNATVADAEALTRATLQHALATPLEIVPTDDLRRWLLGLQRAVHAAMRPLIADAAFAQEGPPARGLNAAWQPLREALLRLPDRQLEALVLSDGACCTLAELAQILDCCPREARRLLYHARAGVLARLGPPQSQGRPLSDSPRSRRPIGERTARQRQGALPRVPNAFEGNRGCAEREERRAFIRRLDVVLLAALCRDVADPTGRSELAALMPPSMAPSKSPARTNWLRLMFVAYAAGDGSPTSEGMRLPQIGD